MSKGLEPSNVRRETKKPERGTQTTYRAGNLQQMKIAGERTVGAGRIIAIRSTSNSRRISAGLFGRESLHTRSKTSRRRQLEIL